MRLLKIKEITDACHNQTRTQGYKVTSINNYDRVKLRSSDLKTEKHEHQQSA